MSNTGGKREKERNVSKMGEKGEKVSQKKINDKRKKGLLKCSPHFFANYHDMPVMTLTSLEDGTVNEGLDLLLLKSITAK